MISANIDIFEMDYEAAITYFIRRENLDKIRCMNGPAPTVAVDNNTSITSRVGVGPFKKKQKTKMWCHNCNKNDHSMAKC